MKQRIAALLVALLATIGMVAVAAPVTAAAPQVCQTTVADDNTILSQTCKPAPKVSARWVYCDPIASNNYITFYDQQGWCGSSVRMSAPQPGQCRYMGQWDNWAGSAGNFSYQTIVLWQTGYCGGIPFKTMHDNTDDPNLYASQLGNAVSTISRGT